MQKLGAVMTYERQKEQTEGTASGQSGLDHSENQGRFGLAVKRARLRVRRRNGAEIAFKAIVAGSVVAFSDFRELREFVNEAVLPVDQLKRFQDLTCGLSVAYRKVCFTRTCGKQTVRRRRGSA